MTDEQRLQAMIDQLRRMRERWEPKSNRNLRYLRYSDAVSALKWIIEDLPDDAEPAAHLESLLQLLEPRTSAVHQIQGTGATAFWSCFVTAKPTGNMLWFEPEVLPRLGELGAALEFDIYKSDAD